MCQTPGQCCMMATRAQPHSLLTGSTTGCPRTPHTESVNNTHKSNVGCQHHKHATGRITNANTQHAYIHAHTRACKNFAALVSLQATLRWQQQHPLICPKASTKKTHPRTLTTRMPRLPQAAVFLLLLLPLPYTPCCQASTHTGVATKTTTATQGNNNCHARPARPPAATGLPA